MFANRVTISEDTLKLNYLDHPKRQAMRKELVKQFIRSKPAGTALRKEDLIQAAGYDVYANGFAFIKGMIKRGEITESRLPHSWSAYYTVAEDVIIRDVLAQEDRPKVIEEIAEEIGEVEEIQGVPAGIPASLSIVQQAKDFAWAYESDSLRDFIKFLETGNADAN